MVYENLRGLRIHQTKMGCTRKKQVKQYTESVPSTVPGEKEEEHNPESTQSVQNLQNLQTPPAIPSKPPELHRVLWPTANKGAEWPQFDEVVDIALKVSSKGKLDQ